MDQIGIGLAGLGTVGAGVYKHLIRTSSDGLVEAHVHPTVQRLQNLDCVKAAPMLLWVL